MALFLDTKKESYRAQRQVSQGAGITLVSGPGCYVALFDCAKRVSTILGTRELQDAGDGIYEVIPIFRIQLEAMSEALEKLSAKYSIALVDIACGESTHFVLVWKINPPVQGTVSKPPTNLDEY